jgi:hypothetical protein
MVAGLEMNTPYCSAVAEWTLVTGLQTSAVILGEWFTMSSVHFNSYFC